MRDNFSEKTKKELAARVGYICSNPNCNMLTIGAKNGKNGSINIGEAAHICAASPGGKRYDKHMTPKERTDISNGIWLCRNCAAKIDRDENYYTKELLHLWKENAEKKANQKITKSSTEKNRICKMDCKVISKIIDIIEKTPNTKYMLTEYDFGWDFQRKNLDPLFNLLDFLNSPINTIQNDELKSVTNILIEKIKQFRYIIAFKGGPSEYGNDSYIIDEISDQKKCNSLCDDIWDAYTNLLDVWHNLQDS